MWKEQRGSAMSNVCLSMYSITENIYYSQLSSVAIVLQPEPNCFTSYNTRKALCSLSLSLSLSLCAVALPSSPSSHVSTSNGQRSSQLFCVHYSTDLSVRLLATLLCNTHQNVQHDKVSATNYRQSCE
jgi:hypothetical protein